ncbi:MAG TPA: low molecular weight phosphotyrosine protein phosphatase, partial [Leucothrix sp.]|nr:low molecular weight phosphotyrosine protein phosphatase [Leucothrix sp.]
KQLGQGSDLSKLHLFMDFTQDWDNAEVPDPYYGGANGFEQVFDMVQSASEGLLAHILKNNL